MCCKLIAFVQRTLTETGKGSGNKVALHILCLFQCLVDFYTHCSKAPFLSGVYNMQLNDRKFLFTVIRQAMEEVGVMS